MDIAGNIPADVLLTAYKGADNTVVVVAINKGSASASLPIAIADLGWPLAAIDKRLESGAGSGERAGQGLGFEDSQGHVHVITL